MRVCPNCCVMVVRENDHGSSIGWTCHAAKTELDALRAELRAAEAHRLQLMRRIEIGNKIRLEEADKYEAKLRDLRAAVLEIAELARTTEGEDTGEFLAYRLREAAKP